MTEKTHTTTITRILGQSFAIGPITVKLAAVNRNKARLVVTIPDDMDIEDFDDYKAIIRDTIVMQDDKGWRRAISRKNMEPTPEHPGDDHDRN